MDKKFRTKAACRIAGIDPQRFNEDVAAGEYPCAPMTTAGKSRVFDEADIAGLFVYVHLTRGHEPYRYGKKLAAKYACGVIRALREGTRTDRGRVDFPFVSDDDHIVADSAAPPQFETLWDRAKVATVCIDLTSVLEFVRRGMKEEANILGEED